MAVYLLDTSAFSDLMREHRKVESRVSVLAPTGRVFICSIVRGEVCYGLESMPRGRNQPEFEAKAMALFALLPCEPVPESAGDHYGRIKRKVEERGLTRAKTTCGLQPRRWRLMRSWSRGIPIFSGFQDCWWKTGRNNSLCTTTSDIERGGE